MRRCNSEYMRDLGKLGQPKAIESAHVKRLINISSYNKSPKRCKKCNTPIEYDNRRNDFCSKSCAASYNNAGVCHNKRKHPKTCSSCGTQLGHSTTTGLCRKCIAVSKFKYKVSNNIPITSKTVRRYLILTRGYKCEGCNRTTWIDLPIPLDSHHIDGNYLNNNDDNLKLMCKNCHAQTDNYGSKNKGNGSERRRVWRKRLNTQQPNIIL